MEDLRRTPVPELQRLYVDERRDLPCGGLTALKADPRAGARAVAEKIERRNHQAQAEGRRLWRLCAFELPLWDQGITLVGGCDEVGMAPLAGPIIKGDAKSITIGAASIVAKVHRDRLMAQLDGEYPGYGFADHKGYPTPEHLDALERLGACALHRRSFAPVAKKLGLIPEQQDLFAPPKKRAGEAR